MDIIDQFVKDIEEDGYIVSSSSMQNYTYTAHPMYPADYLEFSKNDLKALSSVNDAHLAVNSISNSKKAIDCRIEDILCYWGISHADKKNARLGFPDKIKILSKMGINTPKLIEEINRYRNKVEHYFVEPNSADATEFYEIAELYIGYTSRYLPHLGESSEDNISLGEFEKEASIINRNNIEYWYALKLNRQLAKINLTRHLPNRKGLEEFTMQYSSNRDAYYRIIALYYSQSVLL